MEAPGANGAAKSWLIRIINALEAFSSVVLMVMMLLTFIDVIGRYVLGTPVFGATEMISTLLALVIFSGLGIANARDKHIVVELFDERIRELAPGIYQPLIQGFSIIAMCLIVYVLCAQAIETYHQDARTVVLEWPLYYITGAIAFLAALSVVSQVLGLMVGAHRDEQSHLEDV